MGRNYALTVPQIKEAAQLYAKGYSLADLGLHFDVSRQAVKNALLVAGVQLRTREQAFEVAILRRYITRPAPRRRGWHWLNPQSAVKWSLRGVRIELNAGPLEAVRSAQHPSYGRMATWARQEACAER